MRRIHTLGCVLILISAVFVVSPLASAFSCPAVADKTATIPFDVGGDRSLSIKMSYFEGYEEGEPSCNAWLSAPLSAFPSIAARPGTAAIAAEIRDTVAEWELTACSITIHYTNDTDASFTEQELCVGGSYGFSRDPADGRVFSTQSEDYCWSDEDFAYLQEVREEMEEVARAQAEEAASQELEFDVEEIDLADLPTP